MPIEIVISVLDATVESVRCSEPAVVTFIDWDALPPEGDAPGFVWFDTEYGPASAYVTRGGASTLVGMDSMNVEAIALAEKQAMIPPLERTPSCDIPAPGDLATVLAALRFWQLALDASRGALVEHCPHFKQACPLTSPEIDLLCQQLNFGQPDMTPEERETWRTTWEPRFGSAET